MKTVFTNSEIVHIFNEQNQNDGRTSTGIFITIRFIVMVHIIY